MKREHHRQICEDDVTPEIGAILNVSNNLENLNLTMKEISESLKKIVELIKPGVKQYE